MADKPSLILDGHEYIADQLPAIDPEEREKQNLTSSFSGNFDEVAKWITENYERYDQADHYIIYRYVGEENKP